MKNAKELKEVRGERVSALDGIVKAADAETVKALRDRFHKTGSIDDAAKLMRYRGQ